MFIYLSMVNVYWMQRTNRQTNKVFLKLGDGDGPNLYKVKKVDVNSTFLENIFRSGLTLVISNDIITIKIDKKITRK